MGLDTTHDCWHGPYSAFARFRDAVAAAAQEYYDYTPNYEAAAHPLRAFSGWWDNDYTGAVYPDDPSSHGYGDVLDVFFIHSDCDGYIFPHHGARLADRLEPLIDHLEADGPDGYEQYSNRARLRRFVEGLRAAADAGEVVEFR